MSLVFLLLVCAKKKSQFALFSALIFHTCILTVETGSVIPSHFLLQIIGSLSLTIILVLLICLLLFIVSHYTIESDMGICHTHPFLVKVILIRLESLQATTLFPIEMHWVLSQKPIIPVS